MEGAAVEAGAVVVVALAEDFAAADDDAAVAVVERRVGGLLEAEGEVIVCAGHFRGDCGGLLGLSVVESLVLLWA